MSSCLWIRRILNRKVSYCFMLWFPISSLLDIIIINSSFILNCLWRPQIPRAGVSPFLSIIVIIITFLFLCVLTFIHFFSFFFFCFVSLALSWDQNNSFSRNIQHKPWLTLPIFLGLMNILQLSVDTSSMEYVHSIMKYTFKATYRTFLFDNK